MTTDKLINIVGDTIGFANTFTLDDAFYQVDGEVFGTETVSKEQLKDVLTIMVERKVLVQEQHIYRWVDNGNAEKIKPV